MSDVFKMPEKRAVRGAGGGIYAMDTADGLYCVLAPTVKLIFPKKSTSEIEIKVVNDTDISKIEGTTNVEAPETELYLHRDVIDILEKKAGKLLHLMSVAPDFTGYKYEGTISYTPNDVETDGAFQGTLKITARSTPEYVRDCFPMLKPTVKFGAIESNVELETMTGTMIVNIPLLTDGMTATVKSTDEATATATLSDDKLTITGKKAGSCIIDITGTKEGYASWNTTIHVIVPKTTTPSA